MRALLLLIVIVICLFAGGALHFIVPAGLGYATGSYIGIGVAVVLVVVLLALLETERL